jgi:hypothetical protein
VRAVTTSRPAARYLVGRDAKVMGTLAGILPDSVRDVMMRTSMKIVTR